MIFLFFLSCLCAYFHFFLRYEVLIPVITISEGNSRVLILDVFVSHYFLSSPPMFSFVTLSLSLFLSLCLSLSASLSLPRIYTHLFSCHLFYAMLFLFFLSLSCVQYLSCSPSCFIFHRCCFCSHGFASSFLDDNEETASGKKTEFFWENAKKVGIEQQMQEALLKLFD